MPSYTFPRSQDVDGSSSTAHDTPEGKDETAPGFDIYDLQSKEREARHEMHKDLSKLATYFDVLTQRISELEEGNEALTDKLAVLEEEVEILEGRLVATRDQAALLFSQLIAFGDLHEDIWHNSQKILADADITDNGEGTIEDGDEESITESVADMGAVPEGY